MKYTCSCGFESDDWGEFLRHVFCKEGMKKAHYIIHPSPIEKESSNGDDKKILLLMSQEEWYNRAMSKGTSGDMVIDILSDWKRERTHLLSHISTLEGRLEIQERVLTENENLLSGLQSANKTVLLLEDKVKELGAELKREKTCFRASLAVAIKLKQKNRELREGIEKFRREMQSPVHLGNRSRALAELYKLIEGD